MPRKLGKQPGRSNPLSPILGNYMAAALGGAAETLPEHGWVEPADWTTKVPVDGWTTMLNTVLGTCTIATVGHIIQSLTSYSRSTPLVMSDAEVKAGYQVFGYNPADPSTDRGAVIMDVLEMWMSQGFMCGGEIHKIAGFVAIDPTNMTEIKYAIRRFGNVVIGAELPQTAETDDTGFNLVDRTLQGPAAVGSWGGHCVPGLKFDANAIGTVSWGAPMPMDWEFALYYCTEMYAVLDDQDQVVDGLNRDGFTGQQLAGDLSRLRQGMSVS